MKNTRAVPILLSIAAITALMTLCCGSMAMRSAWRMMTSSSNEQDPDDPGESNYAQELGEVNSATICREFRENWTRAFAKYRKREMAVIGTVDSIGKDYDGQYFELFEASSPRMKFVARNANAKATLTQLHRGDVVRVKCKIFSKDNFTVYGERWTLDVISH